MSLALAMLPSSEGVDLITPLYQKALASGDKSQDGKVLLASGHELGCHVEMSSKGNGTVQIGGLMIRSHDRHDDGLVFEGGTLRHQLADVDSDGDLDLVVSGVAVFTEGDVEKREAVVAIFIYDRVTRMLKETVKSRHIYTMKNR